MDFVNLVFYKNLLMEKMDHKYVVTVIILNVLLVKIIIKIVSYLVTQTVKLVFLIKPVIPVTMVPI